MSINDGTGVALMRKDVEVIENKKNGWIGTAALIVGGMAGGGVLSLPSGINESGWIGIGLLFVCVFAANYAARQLGYAMSAMTIKVHNYSEIGQEAFGFWGRLITEMLVYVTMAGITIIFLILLGLLMNGIVPTVPHAFWTLVFGIALIPLLVLLKSYGEVSWTAYLAVAATLVVVIIAIAESFILYGSDNYHIIVADNNITHKDVNLKKIAQAFNVITFSYGSTSLFPNYWSEMKNKKEWNSSLWLAYALVSVMYVPMSVIGYLVYGSYLGTPGVSNILDALLAFSDVKPVVLTANAIIVVHLICAIPIVATALCSVVENATEPYMGYGGFFQRLTVRPLLMIALIVIALALPYFLDLISIITALSVSGSVYILPPLFHIMICREDMTWWRWVLHILCILFGVLGSIIGLWQGVESLTHSIKANPNPFKNMFHFGK